MNGRPRIVVTESAGFACRPELEALGDVAWENFGDSGFAAGLGSADVLWVRLRHYIGREALERAPDLKIIVTPTTGLTHIDVDAARRRGIEVLSLRDASGGLLASVRATAEHTVGLMLALLRNIPAAAEHVRAGGWDRDLFRGAELCGRTVGVVGYGRLGRIVARYLSAFDCDVVAADPYIDPATVQPPVRLRSLDGLLESADIVSLHADLRPESRGFFGAAEFQRMKPGAWFVNTARGELVDEAALVDALRSGRIAGAAVDVVAAEQQRQPSPLLEYAAAHPNLLITPHIGGCTAESMRKTEAHMIEILRGALARLEMEVLR